MHHHHHLDQLSFLSFFMMGLFGSLHCLGMCGPLSALFVTKGAQHSQQKRSIIPLIVYHLSRLFIYGALGFILSQAGLEVQAWVPKELFITVFALLAVTLIFKEFFKKTPLAIYKILQGLVRKADHLPASLRALIIGLATPLLPCGLLYAALSMAPMSATPWLGFIYLAGFGLGTSLPMILGQLGLLRLINSSATWGQIISKGSALASLALSIYFLYRH